MDKYDRRCHLYINKSSLKGSMKNQVADNLQKEDRDEFLAVNIGQLIRLYAKSKSMSIGF